MIALWILGILVALLGVICCIPVGITGEYGQHGANVKAHIGPLSIQVYPRPIKIPKIKGRKKRRRDRGQDKTQERQAKQRERETQKREKTAAKTLKKKNKKENKKAAATQTSAKEQTPQETQGGGLELFREIVGLALKFQEDLRNRLHVRTLVLRLYIGAKEQDPAQAAVLYGSAWAALGNLTTVLQRAFQIHEQDTRAEIDFLEEKTTIYAKAHLTMTVGAILGLAGYYGLRGIKLYRTHTKKGGSEHGTSN